MNDRRSARAQRRLPGEVPPEFANQLDPFWFDADRIRARFPKYFGDSDDQRMRMGARAAGTVVARWCLANGFESTRWPGFVDWHALRAATGQKSEGLLSAGASDPDPERRLASQDS